MVGFLARNQSSNCTKVTLIDKLQQIWRWYHTQQCCKITFKRISALDKIQNNDSVRWGCLRIHITVRKYCSRNNVADKKNRTLLLTKQCWQLLHGSCIKTNVDTLRVWATQKKKLNLKNKRISITIRICPYHAEPCAAKYRETWHLVVTQQSIRIQTIAWILVFEFPLAHWLGSLGSPCAARRKKVLARRRTDLSTSEVP